jgi:hypothetical protein
MPERIRRVGGRSSSRKAASRANEGTIERNGDPTQSIVQIATAMIDTGEDVLKAPRSVRRRAKSTALCPSLRSDQETGRVHPGCLD